MLGFFKKLFRPQASHAVVDPAIAQINVEARNKAIRLLDIRIENLYQELGYYAPAQPAVPSPNVSSSVPLSRHSSGHQAPHPTLQALPSLASRVNAIFRELEERANIHTPPTRPGAPVPRSLSGSTSPRHRTNLTALDTPAAQILVSAPRSQQRTRRSRRASDVATTPAQQNRLAGTIPLPGVTPSSQAGSIESGPRRLLSPLGSIRLEQLQSVASQPAEQTPGPTTSGQPTRRDVSTNQSTLVAGGTYPGQERRSQTPRLLLNFAEVGRHGHEQPVLFAELQDDSRLLVQLIEKVQFRVAAKVESCMDRVSKRRARGNLVCLISS